MLHGLLERFPLAEDACLLASGEYQYQCNGQPVQVFEPWLVYQADGQCWIRSERIATDANVYIHVLARLDKPLDAGARVVWFEVQWHQWDSQRLLVGAEYEVLPGQGVRVRRQQYEENGHVLNEPRLKIIETPSENKTALVFPLLRIFMGSVISGVLAEGGQAEVIIPAIVNPANVNDLLGPLRSQRSATALDGSDEKADVFCFDYCGDQYQQGSLFSFNRVGLLLDYQWQQSAEQRWQVKLINLQGRADVLALDLGASLSSGECDEAL